MLQLERKKKMYNSLSPSWYALKIYNSRGYLYRTRFYCIIVHRVSNNLWVLFFVVVISSF